MQVYKRLKGRDEYSASENTYQETERTFFKQMCITIFLSGFGFKQLSEHEKTRSGIFISHKMMCSHLGNTVAIGTHNL
jgi:hypothetical protein